MNPFRTSHKTQAIRAQYPYFPNLTCGVCLQNTHDYSPFGVSLDGRTIESNFYLRGFNGMEKDDEISSDHYTAEFWEYESRLGKRWNLDPVHQVNISDYAVLRNNPLSVVDPFGDKPTPKQAAQMSNDVYNTAYCKYKKGEKAGVIDGGWKLSNETFNIKLTDNKSGFNSAVYERVVGKNKNTGKDILEYTYVTQGSDIDNGGIDLIENKKQAMGEYSQQYNISTNNAAKLTNKLDVNHLSFAGHSLGGGLASANALKTGYSGITFNAAGISNYSRTKYGLNKSANIQAYVVEGEIVHTSQKLLGLRAEGRIIFLPATYIPMESLIYVGPQVRSAAAILNLGLQAYNHTMGVVLEKMKEQGIK